MAELVHVTGVVARPGHRLLLSFGDGTVGELDLSGRAWEGIFEPLADPAYFGRVRVDPRLGTIVWPNGADMAPETLHSRVLAQAHA